MLTAILTWGIWLGQLTFPNQPLPFNFELKEVNNKPVMIVMNGDERLSCDEISTTNDSLFVKMPFFDSEFKLAYKGNVMSGVWINHGRKEKNIIPFSAIQGISYRFKASQKPKYNITGKWETWFDIDNPDSSIAIGQFEQNGSIVKGTFLTETGDHRFLQGIMDGDSLKLSVFDGVHAWLYLAKVNENTLTGMYYSGIHYQAPFNAKRNENVKLRDPSSITTVDAKFDFQLPDLDSSIVTLNDKKFKQKVIILQIMGSWCPNCMDESILFNQIYKERKNEGLEIIGLGFEKSSEYDIARNNLLRIKRRLNIEYPILVAGVSGAQNVMKTFPNIKNFISFPTSIFIDRSGNVVKVHAGYSGPATGAEYEIYQKDLKRTLDRLLR
jgi:thiol-disulfide isomerase/thioredoxin